MKNKQPINKRKIFWIVAIVGVAAIYQIAHPYLERRFNVELPSIMEDDVAQVDGPKRKWDESDWAIPDVDKQAPLIGETEVSKRDRNDRAQITNGGRSKSANAETSAQPSSHRPFLTSTGKKNRLRSPAGLIYGESHGEHRVDHVMRHAKDDPSRPVHSVFNGEQTEILKVIDEAYKLVKSNSKRVKKTADKRLDFRTEYTVDMKRRIGYLGGKRGKRENYPPRNKITLILDNEKFVVTAYPDN